MNRTVYPTHDRQTAIGHLEGGTRLWSRQMLPDISIADTSADELFAQHSMYYGTASEVTHSLANDAALELATDLLIQVQPGFPTFAQTVSALETIATEVARALGWHPATCA